MATTTVGDYVRPLFPGLSLPDSTHVGLQRAIPVGPLGSTVRDMLSHVRPGETFADTDWVTVSWDDDQTLADTPVVVGLINDSFDGSSVSSAWTTVSGNPTVSAGKLHLSNAYPQSQITSVLTHVLANTTFSLLGFNAVSGSGNDGGKNRGLIIQDPVAPGNFIQFAKYTASQWLARTNPGTTVVYPYSATAHASIRIRSAGSLILFETSPDRVTWNVMRSVTAPSWVPTAAVKAAIFGGAYIAAGSDPATESTVDQVTWT